MQNIMQGLIGCDTHQVAAATGYCSTVAVVVATAAAAVPLVLLYVWRRGVLKRPPSPGWPWLPIIGHLLHIVVLDKINGDIQQHVCLYNLSRKRRAPLMWMELGRQPMIVASSAAAAREILQTHDHVFAVRPRLEVPVLLHGCADILFASPSDPHWKCLRLLFSSNLFVKRRLEAFRPLRLQEVRALLTSIFQEQAMQNTSSSSSSCITIRAHAHALTSNIICRMTFGKRLHDLAASVDQAGRWPSGHHYIIDLMTEMNDLLQVFSVADYFPFLAPLDLQGYRKQTKALAKKFDALLQDIIESRLREVEYIRSENAAVRISTDKTTLGSTGATANSHDAQDFLDLLLQAASPPRELEGTPAQISFQNVKAALMNMFGGGIDTAALTIESVLGELLANPSKMRKLREELVQVVGTARLVEESDLASLPYLQAVVKETMRLHPVVPLLLPHSAGKACEVMGYQIPENTIAFINVWAIGRDPDTWESPLEFLPERFEGKAMDVNGQYFELLPFGAGRRGCPGWMLGLVMVQIAVASLVQAFEWELATELSQYFSDDLQGLVFTSSNPLIAKASPNLAPHLLLHHDLHVSSTVSSSSSYSRASPAK